MEPGELRLCAFVDDRVLPWGERCCDRRRRDRRRCRILPTLLPRIASLASDVVRWMFPWRPGASGCLTSPVQPFRRSLKMRPGPSRPVCAVWCPGISPSPAGKAFGRRHSASFRRLDFSVAPSGKRRCAGTAPAPEKCNQSYRETGYLPAGPECRPFVRSPRPLGGRTVAEVLSGIADVLAQWVKATKW